MRKILLVLIVFLFCSMPSMAANFPDNVKAFIKKDLPNAEIRFDGMVIVGDTLYVPLFPAKILTPEKLAVRKTVPAGKTLKNLPDIVVLNNDFVLMKVIEKDGKRTVLYQDTPFVEVRTGLLPQDLLVPSGFVVPENIKPIIGGLKISTLKKTGLKVSPDAVSGNVSKSDYVGTVAALKNKIFYIVTSKSKNIQVMSAEKSRPDYALAMNSIPIDIKAVNNKFLLVTSYGSNVLDVVSLADEAFIKTFEFTAQPEQIVMDSASNKAYITVPSEAAIYVIDTDKMLLKQKIQVNGFCAKLCLTADKTKLIYVDKNTNDVWSVELDNNYEIKEIGTFPNISSIAYSENKIYLASRTKNRVAVVDYATLSLLDEFDVAKKPVEMFLYGKNLFILSAEESVLEVYDTEKDQMISKIKLNTNNFPANISQLGNTNIVIVSGARAGKSAIIDLNKKQVVKTSQMDIPVGKLVITERVKKINK